MTYKIQDFETEEIGELRLYIEKHVPYHIMNKLYILSNNSYDRLVVFTGVYRILMGCSNYASEKQTREKIDYFLKKNEEINKEALRLVVDYSNTNLGYIKMELEEEMFKLIKKYLKNIDELIDLFIVLGEHIELIKTDAVVGVEIKEKDDFAEKLIKQAREIAKKEGA